MQTAYAYARFSSENQRTESIDAQLRAIREYCDREGIVLVRAYKDEAFSGRTDQRPQFLQMFRDLGGIDFVIVHKLDRFARNRSDAAFYRAKLKEKGARLVSVSEPIGDSPIGIITEGMLETINEWYSANLGMEVKKGMKENVLQGKRNGGPPPTGYRIQDQKLVPGEKADTIRTAFRMYANGVSCYEIARQTGINRFSLNHIFRNEVYIGTLVSGDVKHENAHEPLIDRETFQLAQDRLNRPDRNALNKARRTYLLSGVCVCGSCGRRIYSMNSKGKGYYLCRTPGCIAHRTEIIDEQVLEILSEKLRPTSDLKARIFELYERRINSGAEAERAKKQNIITRQRISRLMESLQMTDDLEVRKMILDELTRARAQVVPEPEVKQADRQAIDAMVDQFFDIRNKDPQEQKQIILRAGIEVVINQDHSVLIRYQTGNCLLSFTIDGGISAQ